MTDWLERADIARKAMRENGDGIPTAPQPTLESLGLLEADALSDCRNGHAGFLADEHAWATAGGVRSLYAHPTADSVAYESRICPRCGDVVRKEIGR
jgi:hypothetical protein